MNNENQTNHDYSEYDILSHSKLFVFAVFIILVLAGGIIAVASFFKTDKMLKERETSTTKVAISTTTTEIVVESISFNSQFSIFEGDKIGAELLTLVARVQSSNSIYERKVNLIINGEKFEYDRASEVIKLIDNTKVYTVSFVYNNDSYIYEVDINDKVE